MQLLFQTSHFRQKQELCRQIATAYKERAHGTFNYGAGTFPGEFIEAISKGKPPEELAWYERQMIERFIPLGVLAHVYSAGDYFRQSDGYEKLANSPFLYFMKESHLRRVLRELPPRRKSIRIPAVAIQ